MAITNNNDLISGHGATFKKLGAVFSTAIYDIQYMDSSWRNFFPSQCYYNDSPWGANAIEVSSRDFIGSVAPMTSGFSKDVPHVDFKYETERVNIHSLGFDMTFTNEEIEEFSYRQNQAGFESSSLVAEKANAAVRTFEKTMDDVFFDGYKGLTSGIFANKNIFDYNSKSTANIVPEIKYDAKSANGGVNSSVSMISSLIANIRSYTKGVVKLSTVFISPEYFAHLQKYYCNSDFSNLEKVKTMIATVDGMGNAVPLDLRVLDRLSQTVDVDGGKPYGDIYLLDVDGAKFRYDYKNLLMGDFVRLGTRHWAANCKFKISDPYIYAESSIVKFTVLKEIDSVQTVAIEV